MDKRKLLRHVSKVIDQMGTPKVYSPNRLKPKWKALSKDSDRFKLFLDYINNPKPSIGFEKLVLNNYCHKTLEAILIEHPEFQVFMKSKYSIINCVNKFKRYENGFDYLRAKGIETSD